LRATAEASRFFFNQKEKTIEHMTEYLGRSRHETEYAYNQFRRWVDKNHRPQVDTIKTTLEAIKKNTPKAATANAASFIDTSIVDQLVKEGYYKYVPSFRVSSLVFRVNFRPRDCAPSARSGLTQRFHGVSISPSLRLQGEIFS
jgi:hypothetical protein